MRRKRSRVWGRVTVTSAVVALVALGLAACGGDSSNSASGGGGSSSAGKVTTIKWAYPAPVPSLLPLYVATDNPSICASLGVKIQAVALDPESAIAAIASNSVQLSEDPATTLLPASSKSPKTIQAIAFTGPEHVALWGAKDVTSVTQLKGKTIAATAQGATADIYIRTLLKDAGLAAGKDATIVYTKAGPAMVAQAVSGHASAFPYPPPVPAPAAKKGFHQLTSQDADPSSPASLILSHAIAVSPSYAASHADVISNALKCVNATIEYIATHKEARDAALVKYAGVPAEAAETAYELNKVTFGRGLQPPSEAVVSKIISTLVDTGIFKQDQFKTPVSQLVDGSYLK